MNWFKGNVCGVYLTFAAFCVQAQSPHGTELTINCAACHTSDGWEISKDSIDFDHSSTNFDLEGQHEVIDCKQCHTTLEFSGTTTNCASCHLDIHQNTVGDDCARCHDSKSWLVNNITEVHRQAAFPLFGAHAVANCLECHTSDTELRFDPMPSDCYSCHQADYVTSTNPDHNKAGFSTDCSQCHKDDAFTWEAADINHDFFPLTAGHAIDECAKCHTGPDYSKTPTDCLACHEQDYLTTNNPNHQSAGIATTCADCHTTQPGWKPADFREHDQLYFPVYSGSHQGLWDQCLDCHTDPAHYAEFTCITCHTNPTTNEEHTGIIGYSYSSTACLACHPDGESEGAFDHNNTDFALTGAHTTIECLACHANGFTGTPTSCVACHDADFNQTLNPNHVQLGLSTDCVTCHTTAPEWNPASFPNHNEFYVLSGAHAIIANDCASCHMGDYNNTPSTCVGCHLDDYNQTTDPSHASLSFSTDCASCHSENAWTPASFDHDEQYFPIYSGTHQGEWVECVDCHTTPGNFALFTCVTCHANPETDNEHNGITGYTYNSTACLACHPTGEADGAFDHNNTAFPLTGAHVSVNCVDCHASGYTGTPTDCQSCHIQDYNQTNNPQHVSLGISTDCASCHTTEPGWEPATFDIHNDYYVLNGAHALISNQCATCHHDDYSNTPNTCAGCHQEDYQQTTNPSHLTLQFSQDCASCHSESAWQPSTFDHDVQHFPIYTGSHQGVWSQCSECHQNPGNYAVFTCITCHSAPETNEEHIGVSGYTYNDAACLACHPNGEADGAFDHNSTAFPLTGSHVAVNCLDCHTTGYAGTPTDCAACHTDQFNQATNPNHLTLGLPIDCASCHTTAPDWNPAAFPVHNDYYVLSGAHAMIADQCITCHNGDYTNTPNTCAGCHQEDYNQTTNPSHLSVGFGNDCASCHNENSWTPANFNHDQQYFPIYSGAHLGTWDQCNDCHTNPNDFSVFTCITCHTSNETDEQHIGVDGYVFNSNVCLACHPTGDTEGMFDHNNSNFPLTGAHTMVDCLDCHASGFEGTPIECNACHTPDYNQATNPNHVALNIPVNCAACHTTNPDWVPATFDIHNDYYPLNGAHAFIADQCVTCHNGDYNNTPNTCVGCHQSDYNQTDNPSHLTLNFSNDCIACHSETAWTPATYEDHDDQFFPIYSGEHEGTWDQCNDCHTNPNNYSLYTCITCHTSSETAQQHTGISGYFYESSACLACHPTGDSEGSFDHNASGFPLTGAHNSVACIECHSSGYQNTPTECNACHTPDYNQSGNPNHVSLGLSTECVSCHTTAPDWNPALFPVHDDYYPLLGAHANIADQCVTCHNGDYNNTPNTCFGCHQSDYNQTNDPDHQAAQFPTNCDACHNQNAWVPSSWDHDGMYFPIYSGKHEDEWNQCNDCHTNPNNYSIFTCITCHEQNETDEDHDEVGGYQYNSSACLACHPDGED